MKTISTYFLFLLSILISCNQGTNNAKASQLSDSLLTHHNDTCSTEGTIFKSTDEGQTWQEMSNGLPEPANSGFDIDLKSVNKEISVKQVNALGLLGKIVESDGVMVATSQKGIIRSSDKGKNWELVISEGGVGIDVAKIKGGFAAINYSSATATRRIRTSYDAGKTWQAIDEGMPKQELKNSILHLNNVVNSAKGNADSLLHADSTDESGICYITSIVQVGESFFCGRSDGIYKSSDNGKTWKCVRCVKDGMMFKLTVSGKTIYAIQVENHC